MHGKKMFKVISPIERRNGEKFWQRCGTGFTNKDDSINIYLDVIPTTKDFTLQLRELTEEDLTPRGERNGPRPYVPSNVAPALSASTPTELPF